MARAFSKILTADTQDVLAGSKVGILGDAPSYDVEVRVAAYDTMAPTTEANAGIVNLTAHDTILQNCRTFIANQGGNGEPRSDGPLVTFNAPGGTRLTLNLDASSDEMTETSVYVEVRENSAPSVGTPTKAHLGRVAVGANATVADVLAGLIVAQVPSDGTYEVSLMLSSDQGDGLQATLLVDTDTVAENFEVPFRAESLGPAATERDQFGVQDRDTVITTLASANSILTLNFNNTSATARQVRFHVNVERVA
ncbi:MAG: hypothetical protein F4103_13730 [Boseongicola sp. SB0673_bin_14]|nr:hypothetical protein [Boseongicola sp. SB0673_bin_14]